MLDNPQNDNHSDSLASNSRNEPLPVKIISSSSHCRDLHHFFKTIFRRSSARDPTTGNTSSRLYTQCFLCPFSTPSESNYSLGMHFHRAHIQPSFKRYVDGAATKLEVLMLFHYACVRDVPTPRLRGYDGIQVVKERNQFYFLHRAYSRGRDIVQPCAKKFAAIAAHVNTLAAQDASWEAKKELRQTMARQLNAALEEALKQGCDLRAAIAMQTQQLLRGVHPLPTAMHPCVEDLPR